MSREQNLATLGPMPAAQKVWVGNLAQETTGEEVDAHFRQLGEPIVAEILRKGTACVGYSTAEEAETAISAFNGSELGGAVIQTDVWSQKPKGAGKGGMGKGADKGKGKGGWESFGVITPQQQKSMGGAWGAMKGGWGAAPAWGGSPYGKGKGGGKSWEAPSPVAAAAQVIQINVGENALTQQGYGPEAPAAVFVKGNDAFSSASFILGEILDSISSEVEIVHDAEWEQFPEIGEALKAASGEEHSFAVGICASRSKWALGCASGWKGRESSVKVGLALAFALEDQALANRLGKTYPEFGAMLRSMGMKVQSGGGWGAVTAPKGKQQVMWEEPTLSGDTPTLHLVSLTQDSKITTEGYPADAPAVIHGGKAQKAYFSNAHSILQELVEDIAEVQFQDDSECTVMPEVNAALLAAGSEECSYCVATCPSQAVWGIGVAAGHKNRETSAKLGLAIAVAQAQGKIEAMAAQYPEFGEICATVGLYQAAPATKKARKAW